MAVRYVLIHQATYLRSGYHSGHDTSGFFSYWEHTYGSTAPMVPVDNAGTRLGISWNWSGANGAWEFSLRNSSSTPPTAPQVYQEEQYENKNGLRVLSSVGELVYDSSTTTWTQLGIFFIDRLAVNPVLCSVQNSGMTEYSVTFWFLNTPPLDRKMLIPTYTVSSGSLSFTHQNNSAYALVLGR